MIATVTEIGSRLGVAATCAALGLPKATFYRARKPRPAQRPRTCHRALGLEERREVLGVLHEPRFAELAPAQVYATLLDEGRYLCSERTMYRVLAENAEVRGAGKTVRDALAEAFNRTGVTSDQFEVTRWAKDAQGKSFPVEWRAAKGGEVSIDLGHSRKGPGVPHVGYQTPGKQRIRGHILLDDVNANR